MPDGVAADAPFVTRTAAIARELGLTTEHAQRVLDAVHSESNTSADAARAASREATLAELQPGGAIWTEREAEWRGQSLADKEIGGNPEKLQQSAALAQRVVERFATDGARSFFQTSGLGSHPELVRMLSRIGKAMGEGTLVTSRENTPPARTEEEKLALRYPTMAKKS